MSRAAPSSPILRSIWSPTWRSRHPGLRELLGLALVYLAYTLARSFAADDPARAEASARAILGAEREWGMDVELAWSDALLSSTPLAVAASFWYAALHFVVTGAVMVLLYRRRPDVYGPLRSALLLATSAALVLYLLLPTAPPRLMGAPYVDVLAQTSQYGWWSAHASAPKGMGSLTNELAAFPSMHAGWALWVAVVTFVASHSRAVRVAGLGYALVTAVVVVVTANHWTLDVLAGWLVVAVAFVVCRRRRTAKVLRHDPEAAMTTRGAGRASRSRG